MFCNLNGHCINADAIIDVTVERTVPRRGGETTHHVQILTAAGGITVSNEFIEKSQAETERQRIVKFLSGREAGSPIDDLFSQEAEEKDRIIAARDEEITDLKSKLDELKGYTEKLEQAMKEAAPGSVDGAEKTGVKRGSKKD